MTSSLRPAAGAFGAAVNELQRSLESARGSWDDAARQNFDRRYADPIVANGRRTLAVLEGLAHNMQQAARVIDELR